MAAGDIEPPDQQVVDRILAAAAHAALPPGWAERIAAPREGDPQPGEVWRAGHPGGDAMLLYVRRVYDDGPVDAIPMVQDVEFASEWCLLTEIDRVPFAVMIELRTTVNGAAFLNRFATLDIATAVEEVITAMRENRAPRGVRTGVAAIELDYFDQLTFRQSVRRRAAPLTESMWNEPLG